MEKFIFTHDGYKKLFAYQRAKELRKLVVLITKKFPRSEYKTISQMRSAARSVKQNIVEGYKRGTINEFFRFLNISSGSAAELDEDIDDALDDDLMNEIEYDEVKTLCRKTMFLIDKLLLKLDRIKNQ